MEPIVTPDQMSVVDAASGPTEVLVARAGWQVARWARRQLGGTYGRRVVVVAGTGNNGADGRVAADVLRRAGARVEVVASTAASLPPADLVIDAAFGTGLSRPWDAPPATGPVLAVDLPSGLDPVTGEDRGGYEAVRTVTFGAWKPGLLMGAGPRRSGTVTIEGIGLDLTAVEIGAWRWTAPDTVAHLPGRAGDAHKWHRAVRVVAGSPGMDGAGCLVAAAALRAGAGMVVASRPDGEPLAGLPVAAVERRLGGDWVDAVLDDIGRFAALAIGPGLGRDEQLASDVRRLIARCPVAVVIDADAIHAVARDPACLAMRPAPTVLTPHDGEFSPLVGGMSGSDRIAATREVAARLGAIVVRKGPATLVAAPDGRVAVVDAGDERLATAGTGDVLTGVIAACDPAERTWERVAGAVHWHGSAGVAAGPVGITAPDVVDALAPARLAMERRR